MAAYTAVIMEMFHKVIEATKKVEYDFSKKKECKNSQIKVIKKERFNRVPTTNLPSNPVKK